MFDHEYTHLSQKGKKFNNPLETEYDVENTLIGFYRDMAAEDTELSSMYNQLQGIAEHRAATVEHNYAGSSYSKAA